MNEQITSFNKILIELNKNVSKRQKIQSYFFHNRFIDGLLGAIRSILNPKAVVIGVTSAILASILFYISSIISAFTLSNSEALIFFTLGLLISLVFKALKFIALGGSKRL